MYTLKGYIHIYYFTHSPSRMRALVNDFIHELKTLTTLINIY